MYKQFRNIILIIILSSISVYGQNLFNKQYDFLKGADVFGKGVFKNNTFYIGGVSWDSTYYVGSSINKSKVAIIGTDNSGNSLWKKRYGNYLYNYNLTYGNDIATIGNNFYFTGTYQDSLLKQNQFLFKFNSQGDSLLLKHYFENDTTVQSYANQCKLNYDGNLMICGTIDSSYYGKLPQMILSKVDTNGNLIWSKEYGGSNSEDAISMDVTSDKGYILGGWTTSYGGTDKDSYVIKTDSLGNFEWQKIYNTNEQDFGAVVLATSDGGYLVGTTETQFVIGGGEYSRIYFNKLDSLGNQLWRKNYGGLVRDRYLRGLVEVNGNYIGLYYKYFENELIKLNSNGDSIFHEGIHNLTTPCYEQFEHSFNLISVNSKFAIVGSVVPYIEYIGQSQHEISQDAWLTTLDSNGCQLPNKPFNLTAVANYVGNDTLIDINWQYMPTSPNEKFLVEWYNEDTSTGTGYWRNIVNVCTLGTNGHYFLGTNTFTHNLSNQNKAKYRVLAVDTTNQLMSCHSEIVEIDLTVSLEELNNISSISIYPNPTYGYFTINIPQLKKSVVEVYDISGKLILKQILTQNKTNLSICENPKGLYFVKVLSGNTTLTRKLIHQ